MDGQGVLNWSQVRQLVRDHAVRILVTDMGPRLTTFVTAMREHLRTSVVAMDASVDEWGSGVHWAKPFFIMAFGPIGKLSILPVKKINTRGDGDVGPFGVPRTVVGRTTLWDDFLSNDVQKNMEDWTRGWVTLPMVRQKALKRTCPGPPGPDQGGHPALASPSRPPFRPPPSPIPPRPLGPRSSGPTPAQGFPCSPK